MYLAQDIQQGNAIAISDGSFKNTYGMAAWVIEGTLQQNQLVGRTIAPGEDVSNLHTKGVDQNFCYGCYCKQNMSAS
jgi:hypothetical protein